VSAIVLERVSKRFPWTAQPAVDACSLTVADGSLTVLLGPSGSGKTTLLKLINRLYEPDGGRILIGAIDARAMPGPELRRRIGYVIQQIGLFPHLRVEQNIATVPELLGWPAARTSARIDELLDLVGLPRAYRPRYPRSLSGGEQQRVGLARALAADPDIMLMDEPFGALDAITRGRLQDELRAIQQRVRKTIVFVTHDVDEALRLADHIVVMRAGRIVQHGAPLQVVMHPHDDFVGQLLASDDVLRRLSLLQVRAALRDAPAPRAPEGVAPDGVRDGEASVQVTASLRAALSLLLASRAPSLAVLGDDGRVVGRLTFDDVRRVVLAGPPSHNPGAF
jgi:osmoprotectant transport system ATP-binding protein